MVGGERQPRITTMGRPATLAWLRKLHGWLGLWGAVFGLLFGVTGFLLNHRAIMRIPAGQSQETTLQLAVPEPPPANARAMAEWLRGELPVGNLKPRIRTEPGRAITWGDRTSEQPTKWSISFGAVRWNLQAEYLAGNRFVSVRRNDHNGFSTLNNLHKSVGVGMAWVLLADTAAGAMILLSVTGVILWAATNRRRSIGTGIALLAVLLCAGIAIVYM